MILQKYVKHDCCSFDFQLFRDIASSLQSLSSGKPDTKREPIHIIVQPQSAEEVCGTDNCGC